MITKKLFIIAALLLLPNIAGAMKPMSDAALAGVSGRSGVSFFVDVTMNIHVDTIAWGDADGLAPGPFNPWNISTAGGYVGLSSLSVSGLRVSPYPVELSNGSLAFWPSPYSIDVLNGQPYYRIEAGSGRN